MQEVAKPQANEFLNEALKATDAIAQLAKSIAAWEKEKDALEEKHGISALKQQIRNAKKEMEMLAFETLNRAHDARQGKLFDLDGLGEGLDDEEGERETA